MKDKKVNNPNMTRTTVRLREGRPPVTVRVDKDHHARLIKLLEKRGITFSDWIREQETWYLLNRGE